MTHFLFQKEMLIVHVFVSISQYMYISFSIVRKPICDTVFYIQMLCILRSKLVTSVF